MLCAEHALCFLDMCAVNDDLTLDKLLQPVIEHGTIRPSAICSLRWDMSLKSVRT